MIDGKILVYIMDTLSMQCCPICDVTPNMMSNLKIFKDLLQMDRGCAMAFHHYMLGLGFLNLFYIFNIELKVKLGK